MSIKAFEPIHSFQLHENRVTDADTLAFARDTLAVYRSLYQGMAPLGEWIQTRVASLVRQWLPGWVTSHGQVADPENRAIQSRSWDIIVHRPIPPSWGCPPPASISGPWPLVPKELCCAVIDTKGRYNTPREYASKSALDLPNQCQVKQLAFLGPRILPVLFIVASNHAPATVEAAGRDCGIATFVIAKAVDHRGANPTVSVEWFLNPGHGGTAPLQALRQTLCLAATQWCERAAGSSSAE